MPNGSAREWEEAWRKNVDGWRTTVDGKLDSLGQGLAILTQMVGDMREGKKSAPRITQGWIELLLTFGSIGLMALCSGTGIAITLLLGLVNLAITLLRH